MLRQRMINPIIHRIACIRRCIDVSITDRHHMAGSFVAPHDTASVSLRQGYGHAARARHGRHVGVRVRATDTWTFMVHFLISQSNIQQTWNSCPMTIKWFNTIVYAPQQTRIEGEECVQRIRIALRSRWIVRAVCFTMNVRLDQVQRHLLPDLPQQTLAHDHTIDDDDDGQDGITSSLSKPVYRASLRNSTRTENKQYLNGSKGDKNIRPQSSDRQLERFC